MQFSGICSQQVVLVGFWGQDFFGRGQDLQDLQDGQDFLGGQDLQDLQDGQDFLGGQDLQDLQDGQDFVGDRICRIYRMDRILSASPTATEPEGRECSIKCDNFSVSLSPDRVRRP